MTKLGNGHLIETLALRGDHLEAALERLALSTSRKGFAVLEQQAGFAQVRLEIPGCHLAPFLLQPGSPQRFPLKVDHDRWSVPDDPQRVGRCRREQPTAPRAKAR